VAELNAQAWKVKYPAHHIGKSLQVLMDEGKQVLSCKHFYCLISSRVIIKDETGAIVQGRQIWPAIITGIVVITTIITIVAPLANLPHLFTSLDMNLK
jgi:hypothetical protein